MPTHITPLSGANCSILILWIFKQTSGIFRAVRNYLTHGDKGHFCSLPALCLLPLIYMGAEESPGKIIPTFHVSSKATSYYSYVRHQRANIKEGHQASKSKSLLSEGGWSELYAEQSENPGVAQLPLLQAVRPTHECLVEPTFLGERRLCERKRHPVSPHTPSNLIF